MRPNHKRPFKNFVKKAHKPLQLAISDEVDEVCERPYDGEAKVGDLLGFYVWKFKFNKQEYLIAYRPPPKEVADTVSDLEIEFLVIDFYQIGSHENFYDDLKRYIKEELS
jgi:hypothetical protein